MPSNVRDIVIAGSGAAAGAAAAASAVSLRGSGIGITLLLSPEPVPHRAVEVIRGGPQSLHARLGIEEKDLCRQAVATFGMGTRYRGLFDSADDKFVPLGTHGKTLRLVDFHHYVTKLRAEGDDSEFNDWSIAAAAARAGCFEPAQTGIEPAMRLSEYDLYVDHDNYREAMLQVASRLDVKIIRQAPVNVELDASGLLASVTLADGSKVGGDFFIDCSDERSLIRHVTTGDDFRDWSAWYSCDRLVTLAAARQATPDLFASIEADNSGWLSQVSTHGQATGNFVYDSADRDSAEAVERLVEWLPGAESGDARVTEFRPGRYTKHWEKNCVAIGPASAVLAPLEISASQVAHGDIPRVLAMLPRFKDGSTLAAEFNRTLNAVIDSARDYQLLRLALANRKTGQFWQKTRGVEWPDSLQQRMALFRACGRFTLHDNEFCSKSSWISSFMNLDFCPASYDPLADMADERRMRADLLRFKRVVQAAIQQSPG